MKTFLQYFKKLSFTFFLFFILASNVNATTYYTNVSGAPETLANWWTGTTGTGTHPTNFTSAGDVFVIQTGDTMTQGAAWTVTGTVQINSGGTLARGTLALICGQLIINGTMTNGNGSSATINGNVSGTGTITNGTTASLFLVTDNWTFSGTCITSISLTLNGTGNQILSGKLNSGTAARGALIINKTSGIVTLGSAITVTGSTSSTFTLTAGTFDPANFLLTATTRTFTAGTLRVGAPTWAGNYNGTITQPAAGVIEYNALGTQTVNNVSYPGHLTISGSGTKTWTLTTARTIGGNLTVDTGTNFTTAGNFTLGVTGTTSVTGTLTLGGTSAKTFTGNVTVDSSGIWNETGVTAINYAGNLQNDGTTFTANTGVHTFSGTTKTISGATTTVIPRVAVTGTYTNNNTLTVATALSGTGGLTNSATGTLNIGGTVGTCSVATLINNGTVVSSGSGLITSTTITNNLNFDMNGTGTVTAFTNATSGVLAISATPTVPTFTTLTATAAGNTVVYDGAGNQTVKDISYGGHLTISGSGTKTWTLTTARTIGGNLTVDTGTNFTTAGNFTLGVTGTTSVTGTLTLGGTSAKTFTGNVTVDHSGIWNETGVAAINYAGNLQNDGTTFTANTGVHTFSGTTKTISGATTTVIPSVAITGTYTNNNTLTVATALSGTGGLTNNSTGTLSIGGTVGTCSVATLINNGTVVSSGSGLITSTTITNNLNFDMNGTGAVTAFTNAAAGVLTISASPTVPTFTTLTATDVGNTVNYNGAAQTVINPNGGSTGYYNLSLSGSGLKTLPLTTFNIIGNLSLSGSATTTSTNDLTVGANLNLANTSILTIGAAKTFTVTGAISNTVGSGGLILQSNVSGTASLIHNTDNVPATVQRYIGGAAEDWHFLSSPISNQNISGSWLPSGTYGNGTGYDLYVWDEPTPCWVYQLNTTGTPNWPTVHTTANFVPGRGYLYSVQASNPTKEFSGNLNNGTINYPLTANSTVDPLLTGFNLIGNPYPSSIDWKASSGWTRSNLLVSGGGYDMWIWNPAANNYGVYNSTGSVGTNSVTQYIAPMQGFFVRAASNANISMTNNVRSHTAASNWMKLSNSKNNISNLKVRIASNSGFGFDEVLFQFGYNSNEVGAAKLFSTSKTAPSTYFKVGKEELSVRYLTNTIDNPIVPLMFKPGTDGNYTLKISLDYIDFDYVLLEDKKTKTLHNLLENPTYQFKSLLKDDPNRFTLYFTPKESIIEDNLSALIYYNGNDLVVDLTKVQEQTEVKVYDILGKVILNKTVEGNTIQHFPISKTTQMLIVIAKSKSKIKSCKVLIY